MTGLASAGFSASLALARRDWRSYDRAFRQAVRAADDLAKRLEVFVLCSVCRDVLVESQRERGVCSICRAIGAVA